MITLVLTNRNRDLRIVKNCLNSLETQTHTDFELVLVDYGSDNAYKLHLEKLVQEYPKVKYIDCPVQGQLWNKSRAINIVLKQTSNPYFLVGDIDLIFRHDFFETLESLQFENRVVYFQVGFLSEKESKQEKSFEEYICHHFSSKEATGISLFPTHLLKEINGYDEFYHGWGAEDTDIHIRLKNAGFTVHFYDKEVLVKHQWHPKVYRFKVSKEPFHIYLERINHAYMVQTETIKRTVVNQNQNWGKLPLSNDYARLASFDYFIGIKASVLEVHALLAQWGNFKNEVVDIEIHAVPKIEIVKNKLKKIFGKKNLPLYDLEMVNNLVLEAIIKNYRNNPYRYTFDRKLKRIQLTIFFQ